MQKIVCNHCGGKWYIDKSDTAKMKSCLFCQTALRQKKQITTLDSLDKVIFTAISSLGVEAVSQPGQFSGYMMDIAPSFKKELRILTRFLSNEYCTVIKEAFSKDLPAAELLINRLRTSLVEEDGLSDSWADTLCSSYMGAIRYFHGIGLEETLLATVEDFESPPVIVHMPATESTPFREQNSTRLDQSLSKPSNDSPTVPNAKYRCRICGYRIENISPTPKCPVCKAEKWEKTNSSPRPISPPAKNPVPQVPAPDPASTTSKVPAGMSPLEMLNTGKKLLAQQEFAAAAAYFLQAAQKNNAEAQYEIGKMYLNGIGIPQDHESADEMLCASGRAGYLPAIVLLGEIRYQNKKYASAWKWFCKAIEKNDPTAMYYAYLFYKYGYHVTKNDKTASRYLDQAVKAGSIAANLQVAKEAHARHEYTGALKLFQFAATHGNAEAQYYLGTYFADGKGTSPDLLQAAYWHNQAAIQGHGDAKRALQKCVNSMSWPQKLKWNATKNH